MYESLLRRGVVPLYECTKLTYRDSDGGHTYLPDLRLPNGVFVEIKGYFPKKDRDKMARVRQQNPAVDLRLVFEDASTPLAKGKKTTYGAWATRVGFEWAEGDVPSEWLLGKDK